MVFVNIKWNKEIFERVELDPLQSVETFKNQLMKLTGVPLERQKIMAKGGWKGILKDDVDLNKCNITDGMQVLLMGTADVMATPTEKVVFMEDLKDEALAQAGVVLPAGLVNLGNTCYMNSTLQCLRKVPELRSVLSAYRVPNPNSNQMFTLALRDTLNLLDRSTAAIPPMMFLHSLRTLHPQFAQQSPRGFMQQDAEELYSALLNTIAPNLTQMPETRIEMKDGDQVVYRYADGRREEATIMKVHYDDSSTTPYYTIKLNGEEKQTDSTHLSKVGASFDLAGARSVVDALFGIEMEEELVCEESQEEPSRITRDRQFKLICNIQGGAGSTVQVTHLHEGIKIGLTNQVEMQSQVLGQSATWKKSQRIAKLPRYICVQFMRFFWKATPDSQDHTGVKCKIMKPVTFPNILDMFEFCTDDLKKILAVPRAKADAEDVMDESDPKKQKIDAQIDEDMDEEELAELKAAVAISKGEELSAPDQSALEGAAGPGLPPHFKGNYEIFAVVTHKGREADGGHYMGWVRNSGDDWLVFDDADVSPCKTEDIMNLKGGGDWHMAYLAFYRYKN